MSKNMLMNKLTKEADELAIQWNKTKDPGIRDQWYKLLRTQVPVSQEDLPVEKAYTYTSDKTYTD